MHFCKELNVATIFEAFFIITEMKMSVFSEVLFFYSWLLANLNLESEFMILRIIVLSTESVY